MHVLKYHPEDFVVEELAQHEITDEGRELLLRVTKRGLNTEDVALALAKAFRVPRKAVGYAGAKDKEAVTTQYFTVRGRTEQDLKKLASRPFLDKIDIEFEGYVKKGLCLGMLDGNKFTITLRNLEGDENLRLPDAVPNYFDEQRFSSNNARIGEALVRKEFKRAASLMDEPAVQVHLVDSPSDVVGAVQTVPHILLKLYLHAFQSRLWNEILVRYIEDTAEMISRLPYSQGTLVFPEINDNIENKSLPLPGFGNDATDSVTQKYVDDVLRMHNLSSRDFVIKQLPNLSLEGDLRDAFMKVTDFACDGFEDDDLHPGMKKARLSFTLGKGSYATMLVKAMFA